MSAARHARGPARRLRSLGLRVAEVATLVDVDTFDDALQVAADAPTTRFARALQRLEVYA